MKTTMKSTANASALRNASARRDPLADAYHASFREAYVMPLTLITLVVVVFGMVMVNLKQSTTEPAWISALARGLDPSDVITVEGTIAGVMAALVLSLAALSLRRDGPSPQRAAFTLWLTLVAIMTVLAALVIAGAAWFGAVHADDYRKALLATCLAVLSALLLGGVFALRVDPLVARIAHRRRIERMRQIDDAVSGLSMRLKRDDGPTAWLARWVGRAVETRWVVVLRVAAGSALAAIAAAAWVDSELAGGRFTYALAAGWRLTAFLSIVALSSAGASTVVATMCPGASTLGRRTEAAMATATLSVAVLVLASSAAAGLQSWGSTVAVGLAMLLPAAVVAGIGRRRWALRIRRRAGVKLLRELRSSEDTYRRSLVADARLGLSSVWQETRREQLRRRAARSSRPARRFR